MKFGLSSSGCNPRPAKGEPAQPVVSLATDAVTRPAMRRHAKMWAVGKQLRNIIILGAEGFGWLEGESGASEVWAGRPHPAECSITARSKRTTQAPGRPTFLLDEFRNPGDPVQQTPTRCIFMDAYAAGGKPRSGSAQNSIHAEVGRQRGETGAAAEGNEGVGGPHNSMDVGERWSAGPGRAKAARVELSFRREP